MTHETARTGWLLACACVVTLAVSREAPGQETPVPAGTPLPRGAQVFPAPSDSPALRVGGAESETPNIMITGYWPPTNEMLRQFSNNPAQNPNGWVGGDWEGRGYNIYAFFPEFPQGLGKGEGDFEVDY